MAKSKEYQGHGGTDRTYSETRTAFLHAPGPPKILVVENDPVLRERLKRILETAGYICKEAKDGQEALSIIRRFSTICLILSDFQMPKMDGLQLLKALKQTPKMRSIPFILVTENSSFSLRKQALRDGALAILYKPYMQHELLHILNRALSLRAKIPVLSGNPVLEKVLS